MELRGYKVYSDILKTQSHHVKQHTQPYQNQNASFADVLGQQMKQGWSETHHLLQQAEKSMLNAASGGPTDPLTVVHHVNQAELQFELATTLRDKLIQAYQEISRMPL